MLTPSQLHIFCYYYTIPLLHYYISGIYVITPYLFHTNYINFITIASLYYWPLYVRYSYSYFIPIISILSLLYIRYLYTYFISLNYNKFIITILLHCYILGIHIFTLYLLYGNCINFITDAPLYYWLLYVRYLYIHFVLIILILLSLYIKYLHIYFMLIVLILSLLNYCTTILLYVKYSYSHLIFIMCQLYQFCHCHIAILLYYYISNIHILNPC